MDRLRGLVFALLTGAAVSAVFVGTALSAPSAVKPPTISGTPAFTSTLTCNNGSWSPDAASFSYAWFYASGGAHIADGRTWRVDQTHLGVAVICRVTATDAQGATTTADSAPVTTVGGTPVVRITKVITRPHGSVTFTGAVSPSLAAAPGPLGSAGIVVYRELKGPDDLLQIHQSGNRVSRSGKWTIKGTDTAGRHTYKFQFEAGSPQLWQIVHITRTVTIKR
jgi:hypothetical protein